MTRPEVVGPDDGPQSPYPIRLRGPVIKGFGRGSKELGIPTANIPMSGLDIGGYSNIESGIYFGWAGLSLASATDESKAQQPSKPAEHQDAAAQAAASAAESMQGSRADKESAEVALYPMVLSIGYNPYYNNTVRSIEVHVMHDFTKDFYNALMTLDILGFIRPEENYTSMDALIKDIKFDIEVSRNSLKRPAYIEHKKDPYLVDFGWAKDV